MEMQSRLFNAAKKNDIRELDRLLSLNGELLHDVALTSAENALHKACKHGSLAFAKKVMKLKPILAKETNHEGFTALHLAAANGDCALVKELVKLDRQIGLLKDRDSRIPLHIAVIKGKDEVIEVLISYCPESLQTVTAQDETALHLALKFNKCTSFKVLMKGLKKHKLLDDLIDKKDNKGNTLVHIATIGKHCEILELLLPENVVLAEVNVVNNSGLTALDIFNQTPNDMVDREIGRILHRAGAIEANSFISLSNGQSTSSSRPPPKQTLMPARDIMLAKWPMDTRNVLLVVLIMTAGATFAAACNPPNVFVRENSKLNSMSQNLGASAPVPIGDVPSDSGPKRLSPILFFMILNTAGFIASMGAIGTLIWSLPLRAVLVFVLLTTFTGYVLSVSKSVPGSAVIIGSLHVLSSLFVWLSALALIFIGVIVWLGAKLCGHICTSKEDKIWQRTIEMVPR